MSDVGDLEFKISLADILANPETVKILEVNGYTVTAEGVNRPGWGGLQKNVEHYPFMLVFDKFFKDQVKDNLEKIRKFAKKRGFGNVQDNGHAGSAINIKSGVRLHWSYQNTVADDYTVRKLGAAHIEVRTKRTKDGYNGCDRYSYEETYYKKSCSYYVADDQTSKPTITTMPYLSASDKFFDNSNDLLIALFEDASKISGDKAITQNTRKNGLPQNIIMDVLCTRLANDVYSAEDQSSNLVTAKLQHSTAQAKAAEDFALTTFNFEIIADNPAGGIASKIYQPTQYAGSPIARTKSGFRIEFKLNSNSLRVSSSFTDMYLCGSEHSSSSHTWSLPVVSKDIDFNDPQSFDPDAIFVLLNRWLTSLLFVYLGVIRSICELQSLSSRSKVAFLANDTIVANIFSTGEYNLVKQKPASTVALVNSLF